METIRSITRKCIRTNKDKLFLCYNAFVSLLVLAFMLRIGGKVSLWADEIAQVGYINKSLSFSQIIKVYLETEVTNLPFFPLVAALWYRIVPHSEKWLYILTELPVAAGVFLTGLCGREWRNERLGAFAATFSAISYYLIKDAGLNFRAYSFTYFFAVLMILMYIKRVKKEGDESFFDVLIFGLVLTLNAYSNYISCIMIVGLFVGDFFLFVFRRRVKPICILSYVMSGVLLMPWFLAMLCLKRKTIAEFWPKAPNLGTIPEVLRYLTGNQEVVLILFVIGMIFLIAKSIFSFAEGKVHVSDEIFGVILLADIWFSIITVFIYSAYINPAGGFFVKRYYLCILAHVLLIAAYAAEGIWSYIVDCCKRGQLLENNESRAALLNVTLFAFILIYLGLSSYYPLRGVKSESLDPYKECAQILSEQNDIYDSSTAIFVCEDEYYCAGYKDYYLSYYMDGERLKIFNKKSEGILNELSKYDRVYVVSPTRKQDEAVLSVLEGYKKSELVEDGILTIYAR